MPPVRVDFYLSASAERQARLLLACRLLEKAYLNNHRVFVFCNDQQQAESLDELLWTFKDDSFIPHNLQGEGPEPPPVIQIGWNSPAEQVQVPRGYQDILLNLCDDIPTFYSRFKRVIELVSNDDEAKNISRMHFRHYRSQQCEMFTHEVG